MNTSPQKHDPYAAFRIRDYRLYLSGWLFALIGTRIQSIAIGWEMYQRTGEALALGLVGLMQALPTMILALPAGYLADTFNRRKLVMLSLLGMTLTSLGLAALSFAHGSIPLMYGVLLLDATAMILGRPARVALLPQLMPREVFPNAVTWNSSLQQIISVLGPAVGGFVVVVSAPAVNSVFVGASNELGGLESGIVAHWFGPAVSVVSGGIGTIVVVLITVVSAPRLRLFSSLHDAKPIRD